MKQEPNARWDYISNYVASQQQILVGSFEDNTKPDGKCQRDYTVERSRKREAQVQFLVASQAAIAQQKTSREFRCRLLLSFRSFNFSWTTAPFIPKGLRHIVQGCPQQRATLGCEKVPVLP